jgi:hypothetical protein
MYNSVMMLIFGTNVSSGIFDKKKESKPKAGKGKK